MTSLIIKLEDDDKLKLEYEFFRHQSLHNAFLLMISDTKSFEHTEALSEMIIEKYIVSLAKLKQMAWNLTIKYGYHDVKISKFDLQTSGNLLIVKS